MSAISAALVGVRVPRHSGSVGVIERDRLRLRVLRSISGGWSGSAVQRVSPSRTDEVMTVNSVGEGSAGSSSADAFSRRRITPGGNIVAEVTPLRTPDGHILSSNANAGKPQRTQSCWQAAKGTKAEPKLPRKHGQIEHVPGLNT